MFKEVFFILFHVPIILGKKTGLQGQAHKHCTDIHAEKNTDMH